MTTETPEQLPDPKLKGYLIIYVDGYKTVSKYTTHIFREGEKLVAVPDKFLPPPKHKIGSDEWWEEGWAVGDNDRGRLCKRFGSMGCMRFRDYDEAVAYISRRQPRFKAQQHVLVYVTKGIRDTEKLFVVRSMDDIDAVEEKIAAEIAEFQVEEVARQARRDQHLPHLDELQKRFGKSTGLALSDLLGEIREKGPETVRAKRPKATLARQMARLKEAGVLC